MSDVLNTKIGTNSNVVMKAARENYGAAEIRTDVVAQILEAARKKQDYRSDVMRLGIEMPDPIATDYLSMMTQSDLLRYDTRAGSYRATKKGAQFLKTYRRLGEFIQLIDEEIGI